VVPADFDIAVVADFADFDIAVVADFDIAVAADIADFDIAVAADIVDFDIAVAAVAVADRGSGCIPVLDCRREVAAGHPFFAKMLA